MVSRQDIRNFNESTRELMEAVDELEELYEQSQKDGVTVDSAAYSDAQERVKDAVANLVNDANDTVDRTDSLEDDEGNVLVDLPSQALERSQSKDLPSRPQ